MGSFDKNPGMSVLSEKAAARRALTACDGREEKKINNLLMIPPPPPGVLTAGCEYIWNFLHLSAALGQEKRGNFHQTSLERRVQRPAGSRGGSDGGAGAMNCGRFINPQL